MQGSKWTEIVVVYAEIFVVVDSELGGESAEFFVVFFRHVLFIPFPGQNDPPVVFQDGELATPKHEQVVPLVRPRQNPPILNLKKRFCNRESKTKVRSINHISHLGAQRGVGIVMSNDARFGQRYVGNGHDHLADTLVVFSFEIK